MNQVNRVCRQCYKQQLKFYSIRKILGEKQGTNLHPVSFFQAWIIVMLYI